MITIPGYQILAQIYESANSLVYRGKREQDNQSVILKVLKEEYPTPQELTRYKQEYEITRNLNTDGVVKAFALEPYQRTLVIILEDFGASSLKQLFIDRVKSKHVLSLPEFLKLAIETAEILGAIHASNIIHKDINPANIVFNPETGIVKIIDFGISTQLTRENPSLKNPNVLEGTLAYMSPEQTGRMNRTLDYRTDFYSLGVTFYELLTGQLPFETTDALELVHCHIAKVPSSPYQLVPEIPHVVSDIVMKLMAKTAEERYQSAWGLKADLETCLTQLQETGNISDFSLAHSDISDKFQIPQKLYGREQEVETLLAAFERVAAHTDFDADTRINGDNPQSKIQNPKSKIEMMLVAGYSGIGKSVLVQEIYKPITQKRGYFISGKFDQFQRNIPYSAVVSALKELVRQLLTESEAQLNQWREKILAAFGSNGQVIIDVIPEVELIVGKQPAVPKLGPSESQNRFNLIFQNFIRAFGSKEHPLVIFLDDLQWADSASLKLIQLMMTDADTQYLFLIGAYRDNEVNPNHPLMMIVEEIRKEEVTVNQISLARLQTEHLSQLIAETLHSDTFSVKSLAELVVHKTEGNPFFVNEFLRNLHAEELLTFDFEGYRWQWDVAQIKAMGITENVVELMISKLKKLPESTQQVLRFAACVGASFDLSNLSIICEKSPGEIYKHLTVAIQSGLILPTSDLDEELLIQDYKFAHDRVQQAAYALIDDACKKAVHLQIGRLLNANVSAQERAEKIFEIADQLNLGRELITDESELVELAQLNLEAGKKAKDSTAYAAALAKYFTPGIEILPEDTWKAYYELTFNLYRERSECEYLCGNFDKAEELFDLTLAQAKSNLERAEIQNIRLVLYDNTGKYLEAVRISAEALKSLGVGLPTTNKSEILSALKLELQLYRINFEKINISELIHAPEMTNFQIKTCMKLLMNMTGSAYFTDQDLVTLTSLKMVNLSIKYGNSEVSAHGYTCWGMIVGPRLVDYEAGYEFGQLGMKLAEQFNNHSLLCKVSELFAAHIIPWRSHLKKSIALLRKSYLAGMEVGDIYGSYSSYNMILQRIIAANDLKSIIEESNKHLDFLRRMKNQVFIEGHHMYQHFILNLQGLTKDKFSLSDEEFDEDLCLQKWQENNFMTGVAPYNIFKTQILFLYGDNKKAIAQARESQNSLIFLSGVPIEADQYLYYSLILTALYPTASDSEQKEYWETLETHQQKMKIWADNCPENFLHKYLLLEAEMARIFGKEIEVIWDLYDRAISSACENEYIQNEALANELAAKFWLGKGKEEIAQLYMKKAHYGYQLWGAKRKVEDLEEKYPQLLPKSTSPARSIRGTRRTTTDSITGTHSASALDLATVIKASQAISGEIVLDKLLGSLMKILIENAGAQCGYLILETQGKLLIEASGTADSDNITVLQSIPIENSKSVSSTIINYVARTSEIVVLSDATSKGDFTNDPYIKQHQPKSILCVPILNQGKLTSIVYLENNLATGAFTPDRLEVLKILSSSAAISLENANELCLRKKAEEELLKAEQKYRSIFENALEGIFQTTLDGHYLSANQALAQIYGYDSPQELIATVSSSQNQVYVDSCRRREFITLMQQYGAVSEFESMVCRKDGKIIWISENARTVYDASGVPLYYQGFVEDITSRKLAEAERIKFTNDLFQLNQAFSRFVPRQFLQLLDKKSIIDVKLGDQVQQEMSVLFSDIRDFTALSESMTPQENFQFINAYLSRMEPAIIENQGFIDKYIGDAIMALFSGIADDAVKAGIAMLKKLREYNEHRVNSGYAPICIGIGINTGSLMLGTVGGKNRMDSTAISDTVNLASRLEGLTKHYGVSLLISGQTLARLHNPMDYSIRFVEQVKVKGKSKAVAVFEVFDADKLQIKEVKLATKTIFEEGLWLYYQHCFSEAAKRFKEVLSINPKDTVAQIYLKTSKGNFAQ